MTVEENRGCGDWDGRSADPFPVGMRVLAVDDDLTCLKTLEGLLRYCKYHVTTTNNAVTALKLLRENRDKFDLVISDVHMPDMDGFKLLELVGLEMDLPVIMLSGNSDTGAVMKGITHGACDYLLKPVRLEEIKNIWQHVVRRRKFDSKYYNSHDRVNDGEKVNHANYGGGNDSVQNTLSDGNEELNRKRKDQNEGEDDECEDNEHENEDSSTQKKPRVVWSIELHRKFVAAVNQLGIDKAVPKRILDLMNVEKLTRENVASHLQKYRLYLKRISSVASHQANIVAALGGRDSSYLPMASLDVLRNYHALAGSGPLPNLSSFQKGLTIGRLNNSANLDSGMFGRFNNSSGLQFSALASSGLTHVGQVKNNSNSSLSDLGKVPNISLLGTQPTSLFEGMPSSLEFDQMGQQKLLFEENNPLPSSLPGVGLSPSKPSSSFPGAANRPQILQATHEQNQMNGFDSYPASRVNGLSAESFDTCVGVSPHLPAMGRCDDPWPGSTSPGYTINNSSPSLPFCNGSLPSGNLSGNISSIASHVDSNIHNTSSSSTIVPLLPDHVIRGYVQNQSNSPGSDLLPVPTVPNPSQCFPGIGSICNSVKILEEQRHDQSHKQNSLLTSSSNSLLTDHGILGTVNQNARFNKRVCNKMMDTATIGNSNLISPFFIANCDFRKYTYVNQPNIEQVCVLEPSKLQGGFTSDGQNSFDDLLNAMIKQEQPDNLPDGDIGCDIYSLGTCM